MVVHGPDRKKAWPERWKGRISRVWDYSPPQTLRHLPALQNRMNWIGNLFVMNLDERSIAKKRVDYSVLKNGACS